jgi:hypothetical protein
MRSTGPLTGPVPVDEPAPPRYRDPAAAFEAAIHDALAAAQTIRQLLGGTEASAPADFNQRLSWQLLDAAHLLQDEPRSAALPTITREAFNQLTVSASTLFLLTHQPGRLGWQHLDQSTTWIAQVTLRAWARPPWSCWKWPAVTAAPTPSHPHRHSPDGLRDLSARHRVEGYWDTQARTVYQLQADWDLALAENLIRRGGSRCAGSTGSRLRSLQYAISHGW